MDPVLNLVLCGRIVGFFADRGSRGGFEAEGLRRDVEQAILNGLDTAVDDCVHGVDDVVD